jgi:hypothetical protein
MSSKKGVAMAKRKKFVVVEKRILWKELQQEIVKRFNLDFSTSYLQNVYHGRVTSAKTKIMIDDLLKEETQS